MSLDYVKQGFTDGDILAAEDLIKIEEAIIDSQGEIKTNKTNITQHEKDITDLKSSIAEKANTSTVNEQIRGLSVQIAERGTGLRFDNKSKKLYMTYSDNKESEGITVGQDLSGYATEVWVNEQLDNMSLDDYYNKDEIDNKVSILEEKNSTQDSNINGVETLAAQNQLALQSTGARLQALEDSSAEYELSYASNQLTLYAITKDEDGNEESREEKGSFKIVSAGESEITSTITLVRGTPANVSRILAELGKIDYHVTSVDSDNNPTGKLTATWTINQTQVAVETIDQGDNSFDLSKYIQTAGDYSVILKLKDSLGTTKSVLWTLRVINMYVTTNLNDKGIFTADGSFNLTVYGLINKTVYVILDNDYDNPLYREDILGDKITKSVYLPMLSHGAHSLKVYCITTFNQEEKSSPILYYDLMYIESGNNTPVIRWPDDGVELEQYTSHTFKFSVYSPLTEFTTIQLIKNGETLEERKNVGRTEQSWTHQPEEPGESIKFSIKVVKTNDTDEAVRTKEFTIKEFKYAEQTKPVETNLRFDFNPKGRSNQQTDYDRWEYYDKISKQTYSMQTTNFDWNNGGWKVDPNDKTAYFCIKAGSRATFNYPLFGEAADKGKNIKIIYKATNCQEFKAPVLKCLTEREIPAKGYYYSHIDLSNKKIYLSLEKVTPVIGAGQIANDFEEVPYKEGDKIGITNGTFYEYNETQYTAQILSIEKNIITYTGDLGFTTIDTTTESLGDSNYMFYSLSTLSKGAIEITARKIKQKIGIDVNAQDATVYLNGPELSVPYVEDEKIELEFNLEPNLSFEDGEIERESLGLAYINADPSQVIKYEAASFQQGLIGSNASIVVGSDTCDVYLYRMKFYDRVLDDDEILQNFIADAKDSTEKLARFERNQILNESRDLDYNLLSQKYPNLRIILITCPRFTYDKDDKVEGCMVQQIMGNGEAEHNWIARNVRIKGQGTSSNEYGTSGRNIDLKFNKYNTDVIESTDEEGNITYKRTAFEYEDEKGTQYFDKYEMTSNSIGVNYINIKVNIASSECANNARLAERFNTYNPFKRDVRERNPKVRDTMEFHPCVIFVKELGQHTENGMVVQDTPQEFPADGQFHFYACGDFGNSKKNHEAFGMDTDAYEDYIAEAKRQQSDELNNIEIPKECIIEIASNTMWQQRYKRNPNWEAAGKHNMLPDEDPLPTTDANGNEVKVNIWKDIVEFRYPEDLFDIIDNEDNEYTTHQVNAAKKVRTQIRNEVRKLWHWIASTDTSVVPSLYIKNSAGELVLNTIDDFDEIPEYDLITGEIIKHLTSVTIDGVEYTKDCKEYRLAKFKNEFFKHFEGTSANCSAFFHYLFTERYLMIDNRAKNTFLHTVDGEKWDLCFNYDDDTALGCDNKGHLTMDYGLEDVDYINDVPVYNAQDSVLWCNIRDCFANELDAMYGKCESEGCFQASTLLNDFKTYQENKPERLQMFDVRRKYLRPYLEGHYATNNKNGTIKRFETYLPMLNGRKTYQRQRFEKYMEAYVGTKRVSPNTKLDLITIRSDQLIKDANGESTGTRPYITDTFYLTPYCDLYLVVDEDNAIQKVRAKAGVQTPIKGIKAPYGDTNVKFYGASMLQDLGDLSGFYVREPDFGYAIRLNSLKLGSTKADYKNARLDSLTISTSRLTDLDVQNCTGLETLNISSASGLKTLNTLGTGIKQINFAQNGALKTVQLNAVESISMVNLVNLTDFSLSSYNNLTKLRLENCPISTLPLTLVKNAENLAQIRLMGLNWEFSNEELPLISRLAGMRGISSTGTDIIIDNSTIHKGSVLGGVLKLPNLSTRQESEYEGWWPDLDVTSDSYVQQFPVTFYNKEDPSLADNDYILEVQWLERGHKAIDPSTRDTNPIIPVKPPSATKVYHFSGWDNYSPMNFGVTEAQKVEAKFGDTERKYSIVWQDENGNVLERAEVSYGQGAEYSGPIPTKAPTDNNTMHYLFSGWNGYPYKITKDGVVLTAQFASATPSITDFSSRTPESINAITQYGQIQYKAGSKRFEEGYFEQGDLIDIDIGWDPDDDPNCPYSPIFDLFKSQYALRKHNGNIVTIPEATSPRMGSINLNHTGDAQEAEYIDTGIKLFNGSLEEFSIILDYRANDEYLYTGDYSGPQEINRRNIQKILDCSKKDREGSSYQGFSLERQNSSLVCTIPNKQTGNLTEFFTANESKAGEVVITDPKNSDERNNPGKVPTRDVYDSSSGKTTQKSNTDWVCSRADRIIIQKKAGSNQLEIYSARCMLTDKDWNSDKMFGNGASKEVLTISENYRQHENNLLVGCGRDSSNAIDAGILANVTIDNLKIYDQALSDAELLKAIQYPKDTLTFWLTQFPRTAQEGKMNWYSTTQSATATNMEFPGVMLELRDFLKSRRPFEGNTSIKNYEGWDNILTRTWLNSRIYNAFPQKWKSAMKLVRVYFLEGPDYNSYSTSYCMDKIFVPCYQEYITSDAGGGYANEGPKAGLIYGSDKERRKYYNVGGKWYNAFNRTRSPLTGNTGFWRIDPGGWMGPGSTGNYNTWVGFAFCI